jgi:hypothetical protein
MAPWCRQTWKIVGNNERVQSPLPQQIHPGYISPLLFSTDLQEKCTVFMERK